MSDGEFSVQCPVPGRQADTVRLGHGSGGAMTDALIRDFFRRRFDNVYLATGHDSVRVPLPAGAGGEVVLTTDSFVVNPLFFPGGDIGKLAVCGSVNDLAMSGARPLYLGCGFVLEEGLALADLERVLDSMAQAARALGVELVAADTKVVERGKGDGIYINTTGVGVCEHDLVIGPGAIAEGDSILLSGDIGRHGMAVLATREGLAFDNPPASDCAPLWAPVQALLQAGVTIHCLRDLTRGGLSTALVELAESAGCECRLDEERVVVSPQVRGACELLGLDPFYVANEGRFVAFVPAAETEQALAVLQNQSVSADSREIGRVTGTGRGQVRCINALGSERLLDRLPGEQLPRIC